MSPDEQEKTTNKTLYDQVRGVALRRAWRKVRENGTKSPSSATRSAIREFDANAENNLQRIYRALLKRRFLFRPQEGRLIRKPSGRGQRPIVLAPVENRIVQRAILDVLQSTPQVQAVLDTPTSFGGIRHRDRAKAISMAVQQIRGDCKRFIRSDIEGFFTEIPRQLVREYLSRTLGDSEIVDLFDASTATDLINLDELGDAAGMFPLEDRGVAQGNPLSPLMGNILLRRFDEELNRGDILCLRYIDDFLLLGPDRSLVRKAFRSAQRMLRDLGMKAYDPQRDREKAEEGPTGRGFNFLGCHVNPGFVEPSRAARRKLIERVDAVLTEGKSELLRAAHADKTEVPRLRFVQTLARLDRVLLGWGHAVSFCDRRESLVVLDRKIDQRIRAFKALARQLAVGASAETRRRVLGVQLLADAPYRPLDADVERRSVPDKTGAAKAS